MIDQTDTGLEAHSDLVEKMWRRREIENYLLHPQAIKRICTKLVIQKMELFGANAATKAEDLLRKRMTLEDYDRPLTDSTTLVDIRGSAFLEILFKDFFAEFKLYNTMPKREFYQIAAVMTLDEIHPEVIQILDSIRDVLNGQQELE